MLTSASSSADEWHDEYHFCLGTFHGMWATIDVLTDWAIGSFLNVTHEQAHLVTSGMMFGTKGKLLYDLIYRSAHPNRSELLRSFGAIRGHKRDVIAHGYQMEGEDRVVFVERSRGGKFAAKQHAFTRQEFIDHINKLVVEGNAFHIALGASREDVNAFVTAALSASRSATTSPQSPIESA